MSNESKLYFCQHTTNKLSKFQQENVAGQVKKSILRTIIDSDKMSYKFSQINDHGMKKDPN